MTLDKMKDLLRDARASRDQHSHAADEASKREREAIKVAKQKADDRVKTAEKQADEARKRERQAVKKMETKIMTLDNMKDLLRDARASCDQHSYAADEASKREREALKRAMIAERQVDEAQSRAVTAEKQKTEALKREQEAVKQMSTMKPMLQDMSSAVKPVTDKLKKFATRTWLAVAQVLGIQGQDLRRVSKASKHMHDTRSSNWEESVAKNTELIIRLRSAGKLLVTHLFGCVRIKSNTVPVEEVIRVIFPIDNDVKGGKALEEIRNAVRSAVAERRMPDTKMLLTLAISSFGDGEHKKLEAMKNYFTHIEPIVTGSKVTFLIPDTSPIKASKTIECRNYSYRSKSVTRGTVVSMMANGKEIKVRHHKPGV